jgi:hypothetical protein
VIGVYALGRAFSLSASAAAFAAALYAVIPAVWIHSVRPLSDGCGAATFLFAAERLVVTARNARGRDLIVGALVSALCAGIRPRLLRSCRSRPCGLSLSAPRPRVWPRAATGLPRRGFWRLRYRVPRFRMAQGHVGRGRVGLAPRPEGGELRSTSCKRWLLILGAVTPDCRSGAAVAALCAVEGAAPIPTLLLLPLVALLSSC